MLQTFGAKAAVAVVVNALAVTLIFGREIRSLGSAPAEVGEPIPLTVLAVHLLFLVGVVVFAHHPVVFIGLLLFFLGFTTAYARYQQPLILREALLVAFFLAASSCWAGSSSGGCSRC